MSCFVVGSEITSQTVGFIFYCYTGCARWIKMFASRNILLSDRSLSLLTVTCVESNRWTRPSFRCSASQCKGIQLAHALRIIRSGADSWTTEECWLREFWSAFSPQFRWKMHRLVCLLRFQGTKLSSNVATLEDNFVPWILPRILPPPRENPPEVNPAECSKILKVKIWNWR